MKQFTFDEKLKALAGRINFYFLDKEDSHKTQLPAIKPEIMLTNIFAHMQNLLHDKEQVLNEAKNQS